MDDDVIEELARDVNHATVRAAVRILDAYRPAARALILSGKTVDDVLDELVRHIGGLRRGTP